MQHPSSVILYTDSTQAVRALRRVDLSVGVAVQFHRCAAAYPCSVRVCWIRRSSVMAHAAADAACHPVTIMYPLPLLRLPPSDTVDIHKENLRRTTRALIPPRGHDLPSGLTRQEEVSLRRVRVSAAVTPSIRAKWGYTDTTSSCPFCPAPVRDADLNHLLWTCPGLQAARRRHLRRAGLQHTRPPDLQLWIYGPNHRSLLDFMEETQLHHFV